MAGTMQLHMHEHMLYVLAQEEGDWNGDVEAPTGAWTTLELSTADHAVITVGWQLVHNHDMPRFWLIYEDNNGFVFLVPYDTKDDLEKVDADHAARFAAWHETTNEEA